jgi:hypothetical protein
LLSLSNAIKNQFFQGMIGGKNKKQENKKIRKQEKQENKKNKKIIQFINE